MWTLKSDGPRFLSLSFAPFVSAWWWAAPPLSTFVATTVGQAPETSCLDPAVASDIFILLHSLPSPNLFSTPRLEGLYKPIVSRSSGFPMFL